ncbi:MAG: hypothetical protein V1918_04165 [Planctomycetota bacterium]
MCAFLPLAEERKGCVRVLHDLGAALSAGGWGTLVVDYAGTGESPGAFELLTWRSVLRDSAAAVGMLKTLVPEAPIAFLGIRLSSRVALELSREEAPRALCLWAPLLDGGEWLAEVLRRSRFRGTGEYGGVPPSPGEAAPHPSSDLSDRQGGKSPAPPVGGGCVDVDGYAFSEALRRELREMGEPPVVPRGCPCRLIQVGPQPMPTPGMRKTGERIGCVGAIQCLALPPIWLEVDVVDARPLILATQRFLETALIGTEPVS